MLEAKDIEGEHFQVSNIISTLAEWNLIHLIGLLIHVLIYNYSGYILPLVLYPMACTRLSSRGWDLCNWRLTDKVGYYNFKLVPV